jgi:ribosomal protein S18 acetylase RimI-like enzyme
MVEICTATIEDAVALACLNHRVHALHVQEAPNDFVRPPQAELEEWFRGILSRPGTIALLAKLGHEPVGYVLAGVHEKPKDLFTNARRWLYLDQISVEAAQERQGVGRMLCEALVARARREGLTEIETDTWAFNQSAQEFFRHLGFSPKIIRHHMPIGDPMVCEVRLGD